LSEIPLNKFEKKNKVIELHTKKGKTLKEISKIVHMSFRDISKIIKAYERKKELQAKRKVRNQSSLPKKPSLSTQSFILYKEGKQIDDVKILLDIPFNLASRYWKQYLKSIGMFESYEFYQDHSYDIPSLLSINNFMKRNNISGKDIANVLREATDIINLNQTYSNLKAEIEGLKQTKNNYSFNQNTNYLPQLLPLGLPKYYYEQL
jgi:transposase